MLIKVILKIKKIIMKLHFNSYCDNIKDKNIEIYYYL